MRFFPFLPFSLSFLLHSPPLLFISDSRPIHVSSVSSPRASLPLSSFSPTPSPPHFYLPATASGTPRPAAFQYAVRSQKPLFLFAMSFF